MGQRARLKDVRRRVKQAFAAASEERKAALQQALEAGPLKMQEILTLLGAR